MCSEETSPDMSAIAARDFENEQQAGQQAFSRRQQSPIRQLRLETPASSSEDGWGQYQRDIAPGQSSLALVPPSLRDEHSPITPASNRTRTSQLLPDKPTYSLFPPPLRATPRNSIPHQIIRLPGRSARPPVPPLGSPFARPAPEYPSSVDTSQANLQGGGAANNQDSDPFTDVSNRSPPAIYSHFQESRPRPPPRSTRRGAPAFRVPSWEQPPSGGVVRKPVPTYHPYRSQGSDAVATQDGEQDYAIAENSHRRKLSRMKSSASRRTTVFSNGSETSFETHEDEDDDIPDSRSMLSPVAEVRSPPTGRVGYPAIPVSASESPTRRARERSIIPSETDSLLSKRLGPDRAKEIAGRLRGPSSEDDTARYSAKWKILVSPGLKGIDRSASPPSTKASMKSPPTPWRR